MPYRVSNHVRFVTKARGARHVPANRSGEWCRRRAKVIIAMDTGERMTVRVTRRFGAAPQRVFDAWLDAKTAGKWLFATASGRSECV